MEDLVYAPISKSFIRKLVLQKQSWKEVTNLHQSFVDKLFGKNKMGFLVPKLQLVSMLPNTGESSLDLRARLRHTIEKIYHSVNSVLFLDPIANSVTCLDSKSPSRKKSSLDYV